jgi:hypothetical protein
MPAETKGAYTKLISVGPELIQNLLLCHLLLCGLRKSRYNLRLRELCRLNDEPNSALTVVALVPVPESAESAGCRR